MAESVGEIDAPGLRVSDFRERNPKPRSEGEKGQGQWRRKKKEETTKAKASKLDVREVVKGVTAIVRKQDPIKIETGQAVYKTTNAYCIFDVAANHRIAWIPMKRVRDVVVESTNGGTTTVAADAKPKQKKTRAKRAA